jgi:putative ATP-dependent endonuclease of OLD family
MRLSNIKIKNFRLIIDAELEVDENTTLIVGRNNTAKTSFIDCIDKIINGKSFSYDDYPLEKRNDLYSRVKEYMNGEITFDDFKSKIDVISVDFFVDYSLDPQDAYLGALSPFIIDVDESITTALIHAEYAFKMDEKSFKELMEPCCYKEKEFSPNDDEIIATFSKNFARMFGLSIYAVNPNNADERQLKSLSELEKLFPFYLIPAERVLGEDGNQNDNSLEALITGYFNVEEDDLDPDVKKEIKELKKVVEDANKNVQKQSDDLLSKVVQKAVGFGYPNREELQLAVTTKLSIDEQIKNQTKLAYKTDTNQETLPSSHNGLGYKNLIKIQFLLAAFAKKVEQSGAACIPLLFIEEPESHMHPQMQNCFAEYIEEYLGKIASIHIQTFLTSHSAHIANTVEFSKIRYAQKTLKGVIYKNLKQFADTNKENYDFIKKYLTLTRCDMFFADKVIFVEGAAERILLPDMISKCDKENLFSSRTYKLPAQYYTIIEIGGAYAHIFIPFVKFLDVPCLVITDIDSVSDTRKKAYVSTATKTSNSTIKWWVKSAKGLPKTYKPILKDVLDLSNEEKTIGKCHIEFQTSENGLCGRSLEEAIKNANRTLYGINKGCTEEMLEFDDKCKTDFALNLIFEKPEYQVPQYIKDGLVWLNDQDVLS